MKILHCCLAAFYIDDFSYQENILPRIHRNMGHDVFIVASTESYIGRVELGYVPARRYKTSDGIPIVRLDYVRWLPKTVCKKLRIYKGLKAELLSIRPDVIFLHDCQFLDVSVIVEYVMLHGGIVYIDCHTDLINSGRGWISKNLLHGIIYRWCAQKILDVAEEFYATLPLRAEFLEKVYGIPGSRISLLPFGVDDSRINFHQKEVVRSALRSDLEISSHQMVFIAGGKIDRRKCIHHLIEAFADLSDRGVLGDAVLVIFGSAVAEMKNALENAELHPQIRVVGWVAADDIHKYFWMADVAVFPGTHSVLWEEAVGLGIPCVFRRWNGIEHVNLNGNCIMIADGSVQELQKVLSTLASDRRNVEVMRRFAEEFGRLSFSYSEIARRALRIGSESEGGEFYS